MAGGAPRHGVSLCSVYTGACYKCFTEHKASLTCLSLKDHKDETIRTFISPAVITVPCQMCFPRTEVNLVYQGPG